MRFSYAGFLAAALAISSASGQCTRSSGQYGACSSDGTKILYCTGYHGRLINQCPQGRLCAPRSGGYDCAHYRAIVPVHGVKPYRKLVHSGIDLRDVLITNPHYIEALRGWRWIFIIERVVTIVAGLNAPFFLVEFPEKVKFLTERQKHIAVTRVTMEKKGAHREHATVGEMMRMLMDWKLGVYCVQYFVAASSVYSLAFFQPIILRNGMGFSYAKAQLLSSPPYVFTVFASLAGAWLSDKIRMCWPILIGQSVVAIAGLLIVLYGGPPGVRYFGLFLATWGTQANVPASFAYGQNQTARVQKWAVVAAAMISIGAAGGVTGSTIFQTKDAPQYLPGMWATVAMQCVYSIVTFCMSMYLKRLNKMADRGSRPALEGVEGFRYAP
ncbi:hypothetical protein HBI81_157050 [Parastagonospora nodorum]|nr:hypothetical protein HBH46_072420 [Parastagonospora nodorum]KAH4130804.1 hypothetical protein HBH45_194280 [Parastagonospora nodorum]KAH4183246.1 hypothetical protein HBH42_206770 [Parastagonospora nodorum]KAH4405020.1 hypothetical protein HBH92_184710 [Parastagonospora nodorum]KAH4435932.1 hypothetical protein HBH91_199430 [Parastagonospora nodorum]